MDSRVSASVLLAELRIVALHMELLRSANEELLRRAERAEAQNLCLLRSNSWRLTAPMRAIRRGFRSEVEIAEPGEQLAPSLPPHALDAIIERLGGPAPQSVATTPREERLRQYMDIDKEVGLELGPLSNPIVPRAPGRQIYYCDYADREHLRKMSAANPSVDVDLIPEIDYVAPALTSTSFGGRKFDYVVASHVIEHVPNVIGWVQTLVDALAPSGRLVLAVPDRRYTFDFGRPLSTTGQMLEALWQEQQQPTPGQVYDAHSKAVQADTAACWVEPPDISTLKHYFTREQALGLALDARRQEYRDCHCWVFEYEHFLAAMKELKEIDALRAQVLHHAAPVHGSNEFHVVLGPVEA